MRKTYETSYQTAIKPPAAPSTSTKKIALVPKLVMPKTGDQKPQQIALTPAKTATREVADSQAHSGYLDLESLRHRFQTEINAKISLPAGPLFSDDEPRLTDGQGPNTLRDSDSVMRTSRSKNRNRESNVAIRASRVNLQIPLQKNSQPKGSVSIEDSQCEFHVDEAHPFHISRETRQKATLGNLKRTASLKPSLLHRGIMEPQEPQSAELRTAAVRRSEVSDDLETSRNLKSAQQKYSSKVLKSIPCLAYYADPAVESPQPTGLAFDWLRHTPLVGAGLGRRHPKDIVLYFHTNGEDLSDLDWIGEFVLKALHINFLAVEYPGYGLYDGSVSEATMMEDAEVVLQFVKEELKLDPQNVVVVGRSLGSGPAVHLAANYNIKGLVLISAFTSIRDVVRDKVGSIISSLISERFKNLEKISLSECPVCIVHGNEDTMVNKEHGTKLASRLDL